MLDQVLHADKRGAIARAGQDLSGVALARVKSPSERRVRQA
jgi:hypothetical protein